MRAFPASPGPHLLRGGGLHDRGPDGPGGPGAPDREVHDAAQPGVGQHHPAGHQGTSTPPPRWSSRHTAVQSLLLV